MAGVILKIASGKIDSRKMEPLKIHEKKSGGWWVTKTKQEAKEVPPHSPVKQKSMSNLLAASTRKEQPPVPVRSNTTLSIRPTRSNTVIIKKLPPTPARANTTISIKSPATKEAEDKTIDTSKLSVPFDRQSFSSRINIRRHNHRGPSMAVERMFRA